MAADSGVVAATVTHGAAEGTRQLLALQNKIKIVPNNYGSVQLKLWWIGDINGDGRPEFVFTSSQREFVSGINTGQPKGPLVVRFFHDNDVILLDANLRQLGRFRLTERQEADPNIQIALADMDGDHKPEIVVLTDKVLVLEWTGKN